MMDLAHKLGSHMLVSFGSDTQLPWDPKRRFVAATATTTGLFLRLPDLDAPNAPIGLHVLAVVNAGSNTFTLTHYGGNNPVMFGLTMQAGRVAMLHTFVDTNGDASPINGLNWMGLKVTPSS